MPSLANAQTLQQRNVELWSEIMKVLDSAKARPTLAQITSKTISYQQNDSVFAATINAPGDTTFVFRYKQSVDWGRIYNKPTTFTPTSHTHTEAEITGLVNDLTAKEPTITTLSFVKGGSSGTQAASASTGTVAVTMNTSIVTVTPTGAISFTSSGGTTGQRCSFIITTSGVSSFVVTFSTGFKAVSTLATGTATAKTFVVSFIYTGSLWVETGRTAAQ